MPAARAAAIRSFWFGELDAAGCAERDRMRRWFAGGPTFDAAVRERFAADVDEAAAGRLDHWKSHPPDGLALVLLLDQFPRNIHRGTPAAYALDPQALAAAEYLIGRGDDERLRPIERAFVYMPLEHAEDPARQERSVALFERLCRAAHPDQRSVFDDFLHHAEQHRDVIARFGRFPYRNAVLGRENTAAESAWLAARRGGPSG